MDAEIPKDQQEYQRLPIGQRAGFLADAANGMSDTDLARKYGLTERTATNWRMRLLGRRKKQAS